MLDHKGIIGRGNSNIWVIRIAGDATGAVRWLVATLATRPRIRRWVDRVVADAVFEIGVGAVGFGGFELPAGGLVGGGAEVGVEGAGVGLGDVGGLGDRAVVTDSVRRVGVDVQGAVDDVVRVGVGLLGWLPCGRGRLPR